MSPHSVALKRAVRHGLALFLAWSCFLFLGNPTAAATMPPQVVTPEQLTITAANAAGDSIYSVSLTPGKLGALISGTKVLNSDGARHGSFDALVWSPNSTSGTLDLIVADATKGQILKYTGPNYGTSSVIFSYAGKGSGPAYPAGLAVDAVGNLFAISASATFGAAPALWVLPFNNTTGSYGAPVLIDQSFSGVRTLALAEVLVAGSAATPFGTATPAWHAGDVLVLVGDTFNSRVIVYSQAAINGVLKNPRDALMGPTSTAVSSRQFLILIAAPFGMDIWPADANHGASLLFTTVDGRVIRFDSKQNAFTSNFASGLGLGLTKLKVGTYAGVPYAFIAQVQLPTRGKILQLGAPPASGTNKVLASVSQGVSDPIGLALSSSGSTPTSSCVAPNICMPVGPQATVQITGPGAANIPPGATILQTACSVPADPRVSIVGSVWSCLPSSMNVCGANPTPGCMPATLDVAKYCPGFPSTILPPTMCGHSGASGSAFQVIKSTAQLLDSNANNIFITTGIDATIALPGPYDLGCQVGTGQYGPLIAWAPRSDLKTYEGTIPEDASLPLFAELTGFCDKSGVITHVESMFAFGLGLNAGPNGIGSGSGAGLFGFVTTKFDNLSTLLQNSTPQITPAVNTTLQNYVTQSQSYFNSDFQNDANDYSCALNSIASADGYLHQADPSSFTYQSPAGTPLNNNPNPAGAIDSRLANLYLTIAGDFTATPNTTWPPVAVPPCVSLTISTTNATVAVGGSATLNFGPAIPQFSNTPLLPFAPTQCVLTATDGTYIAPGMTVSAPGSVSTGTLTQQGKYSATLECGGGASGPPPSVASTSVQVAPQAPPLTSVTVSPAGPSIVVGQQEPFTASGIPAAALGPVTWATGSPLVASVSDGGVATCLQAGPSVITATDASTGINGSTTLTCIAATPVLASIAVAPTTATIPSGATQFFSVTAKDSLGHATTPGPVNWSSSNYGVATVSYTGLATCAQMGTVSITATSSTNSNITSTASLTCTAAASIIFSANPTSVPINNTVTLTWSSNLPAADSCTLTSQPNTGLQSHTFAPNGSAVVEFGTPGNVTYTLQCMGTVAASAQVTVLYTQMTTYQYTGNPFPNGDYFGEYSGSDRVIASITVSVPFAPNLSNVNPSTLPGSFVMTMSDGLQTLVGGTPGITSGGADLSTNQYGVITGWSFSNSTTDGKSTISTQGAGPQGSPPAGSVDVAYRNANDGARICTDGDCGSIAGTPGFWTSTTPQNLQVLVGSTTGQLYEATLGGPLDQPMLSATTILNQAAEPTTCPNGTTVASGANPAVSSLSFLRSGDVAASNANVGDIFLLRAPSYQPTSDIANASQICWSNGPTQLTVTVADVYDGNVMVGAGVDGHSGAKGLYYFPPNPSGNTNYVFMDDVNADPSLTSCQATTGIGCVSTLVDAVGSKTSMGSNGVVDGDLMVLVGDAYAGNTNPVVLDFTATNIATARTAACGVGIATPCFANNGGKRLVTQNDMPVLQMNESPVSMDNSLTGYLYIATSFGNIYRLTGTTNGYGLPMLYASGLSGISKLRVSFDTTLNADRVFVTVQGNNNGIYEFAGVQNVPFGPSGTGVGFTTVNFTPAGLAVH